MTTESRDGRAELEKETASLVKDASYQGLSDDDVAVFKLANYGFINALQKGRGGEEPVRVGFVKPGGAPPHATPRRAAADGRCCTLPRWVW